MPAAVPVKTVPTIGLHFDGPEIPARTFLDAAGSLLTLLDEVGRSLPEEARIEWQVADFRGESALAAFRAPLAVAVPAAATIARTVSGLRDLEVSGSRPEHFSSAALASAAKLAALMTRPKAGSLVFSERVDLEYPSVEITSRSLAALERLGPSHWKSTGSVRGVLETMTIHGVSKLVVYDPATGERTDCHCAPEKIHEATALFGKQVVVRGEIVRDSTEKRLTSVHSIAAVETGAPFRFEDYFGLFADDPVDFDEWSVYVRERWMGRTAGHRSVQTASETSAPC